SSPQWSKVPRSRWGTSPGGHTSSWSSGSPSWRVPSALGSSSVVACEGAAGSPSRSSASAGAVARGTVTAMAAEEAPRRVRRRKTRVPPLLGASWTAAVGDVSGWCHGARYPAEPRLSIHAYPAEPVPQGPCAWRHGNVFDATLTHV